MHVDLQQFRREGFLILRNVVPPERLDAMRLAIEWMVDREKARSASARQPGDPLGGAWYEKIHPRLNINSIDAETADVIDFCLGETTLGVSAQLMQAPVTAPHRLWRTVQRTDRLRVHGLAPRRQLG